jgi:hypothetical protein
MILAVEKHFNKIFWITAFLVFVIVCLRAFLIPFSHDEAATFFFYIQSDNYLPYQAHVYTNNHVLNSALANLCYHIAGSHRFVLRIPNIVAFILLCIGIYRHFKYLTSIGAKLILVSFFLLTFNFLDFFELCRGYGLSLGFMLLGLSYLTDYFNQKKFKAVLYFSICWQLALASNLILVVVFTIVLLFVFLFQLRNKIMLQRKNIILQLINLTLLIFWIKFSFFYKEQGVLDYGVGTDYWQVTFKTLMFIVFGTDNLWLQVLVIIISALLAVFIVFQVTRKTFNFDALFKPELAYPILLFVFVLAFYLQKLILNVNYPEDRTGLFFYLFFVLSLAFIIENVNSIISKVSAIIVFVVSMVSFVLALNFTDFTTWFYHTMPKSVYEKLQSEFELEKKLFTIGGHRVREMNYAYANYRGNSVLNAMDNSEQMQMNCDYYYAMKREKPYYQFFYNEIAEDKVWDRVLLKRKEKIKHQTIFETYQNIIVEGSNEFYDFKRLPDTSYKSHNPIEIEAELLFEKVPKPFNGFFVMSMQNANGETFCYKRIPLNWLDKDLNGKTKYLKLTSGNLPDFIKGFTVHIWNIDKQEVKISMKSLKIYQLFGKGVDFKIPENYYKLIEGVTKKPLL